MTPDNLSKAWGTKLIAQRGYESFRSGFRQDGISCPPRWEWLEPWQQDAMICAALQMKVELRTSTPLSGREEGLEEAAIAAESHILANVPVWADPTLINRTFNTMEETKKSIAATIRALKTSPAPSGRDAGAWPEAVSDGLTLPCSDCGEVPRFDYHVTEEFWELHVPEKPARLSVVCLPCLDRRCGGVGLADALVQIQWTGTKHTVVLNPTFRHVYDRALHSEQPAGKVGEE